jgi:hypothetical protein
MNHEQTYRIVGIQANGERFIITERTTGEIARRIRNLVRAGSRFSQLIVEPEPDDISPNEQPPRPVVAEVQAEPRGGE